MKKLILYLLLAGVIQTGHSQIVLEEAELEYVPYSMKADPVTNMVTIKIKEKHVGEFQNDPLAYIENRFSIQQFINENQDRDYDSYHVNFKTRKGKVRAWYDKEGEMVSTYQRFKNVQLPDDVKLEIYRNYKNSRILKNKHIVTSKKYLIDKEYFTVKIADGDQMRRIRVEREGQGLRLAGL